MTHIRPANSDDHLTIDAIHRAAFPQDAEARLVTLLIERGKAVVSLVAEVEGRVVGHVLFSPVAARDDPRSAGPPALGLAPLAVLPDMHGQGIGSALVRAGLEACRQQRAPFVVVLGDPAYYGRFGFQPASRWGLSSVYGGGDAFECLPLNEAAASIPPGELGYASEFAEIFGTA